MKIDAVEVVEVRGPTARDESVSALYVEVATDGGPNGIFGPIQAPQADVIRRSLAPFLLGRDALAVEAIHHQLLGLDRHGRSGLFMTGVSPVDCVLWDLKGKALGLPLWRVLGGPTRERVSAYASMLGFSTEPDEAAAIAAAHVEAGYPAQKWFFAHGPANGAAGTARNLDLAVVRPTGAGAIIVTVTADAGAPAAVEVTAP